MTLTDAEVMHTGGADGADLREPGWRRWGPRLTIPALVIAAAAGLLWQSQPWAGPPATDVRVLVTDGDSLTWVDVDTGDRTPVPVEPGWSDPLVVGDGVVVQYPSSDAALADRVVGYRPSEMRNEVGEADRVVAREDSGLWLVVDGDPPDDGAVALTTAFGEWRSRIFAIPPRFEVAGATEEGLVAVRGPFRYRTLQLWDVQLGEVIRDFGLMVGVREVVGDRALVTTGCLTSGCSTAVLDLSSGRETAVASPLGYTGAGVPRLTDGGVAMALTAADGATRVAIGRPESPEVIDVGEIVLARGAEPLPTADGWLALTSVDGSVVLWKRGLDADHLPTIDLGADERMVGVVG